MRGYNPLCVAEVAVSIQSILRVSIIALLLAGLAVMTACNFSVEDEKPALQTYVAQTMDAVTIQFTLQAQAAQLTALAQTLAAPPSQAVPQPQAPAATQPVSPPQPEQPTQAPPPSAPATGGPPQVKTLAETVCLDSPKANARPAAAPLPAGLVLDILQTVSDRSFYFVVWMGKDAKTINSMCWVPANADTVEFSGDLSSVSVLGAP